MLATILYVYLAGFALFLLGFSVFMYFESRKFGDNQFTVKLLPPPPRLALEAAAAHAPFADATKRTDHAGFPAAFSEADSPRELVRAAYSRAA